MKQTLGAEQLPPVSEPRGVGGNNSHGAAWFVSEQIFEQWAVLTPESDSFGNGVLVTAAREAAHGDVTSSCHFHTGEQLTSLCENSATQGDLSLTHPQRLGYWGGMNV